MFCDFKVEKKLTKMVRQSAPQSVGEQNVDSLFSSAGLMDSSVDLEETFKGGDEHTDDVGMIGVSNSSNTSQKKEEALSHQSLVSRSSSNDSCASKCSRESDSDLSIYADSDDDSAALEGVLQMGCMDVFFLPSKSKKKSLIKRNRKGKKELNLNIKGPLALGLEAKMRDEAAKRNLFEGSLLQDTINCGTPSAREAEFDNYRSLMSLSDGSEDDDCDNSVVPENLSLPPSLQPFQNQRQPPHAQTGLRHPHQQQYPNYHQQQYQRQDYPQQYLHQQHGNQQANFSYDSIVNGGMPPNHRSSSSNATQNNQRLPQTRRGKPLRSPLSTVSMPSQISVEEQSLFDEEESHLSNGVDPPPSSLSIIVEDDYPDSSSEEGSVSSMVARGSMISETQGNASIDSPQEAKAKSVQKTTPKKGGRSKVERWRKANIQRLKKNQHLLNERSSIEEEKDEGDRSVDSDQATYSSKSASNDEPQKKDPDDQTLAFDSIFSRRIEKRRAAKLKNNNSEEKPISKSKDFAENSAEKSKSSSLFESRNDSEKAATLEMPRNDNTVHGINISIPEPIATIPDSNPPAEKLNQSAPPEADSSHDSFVIEAVAAAAALALNKDYQPLENPSYPSMENHSNPSYPSMENPSFDKEDTENRVPPPIVKGKDDLDAALPSKTKVLDGDFAVHRRKNPFQDDDIIDGEDIYEDELMSSSSEIADVLQPVIQTNLRRGSMSPFHSARGISSPLASRRGPPMTPSPRRLSRPVASPRHFNEWNDTMHTPSSRAASSPSGMLNRTDSIKCADSADAYDVLSDSESDFFESSMFLEPLVQR